MKINSCRICFLVTGVILLSGLHAWGASGTWNSTNAGANAFWTNSLNWSASPYPGVSDTATFNNSGNGQTTIDLTGLPGVLNITFDTASVTAYTIGASGSQTHILRDGGEIKLSSTAANSQTFNATVRLGPDTTAASYSLRNDNPSQLLTFNNVAGVSGSGTKSLNLNGAGPISIQGTLNKEGGALTVYDNSTSTISLSGNSTMTMLQINGAGAINLAAGTTMTLSDAGGSGIMSAQDFTINGPGALSLSTAGGDNHLDNGAANGKTLTINAKLTGSTGFEFWHSSYYGTIALYGTNDYTMSTIINVPGTIQINTLANKGSACSLGTGSIFILNAAGSRFRYVGTGDTSDRSLDVRLGGILEQAGTGSLKITSPSLSTTSGAKTLVLQGSTSGTGEFAGALVNGSGTLSLTKDGTGTWTLSSTNTYSGATLVTNGTLVLSGALGSLQATSGITVMNGGTLLLNNTASANNTNRLNDSAPIVLAGGTLNLSSDAGAASFSETVGTVTLSAGSNAVAATQAADGQSNVLRIASLTRSGGYLNFVGTGIGESDRNRIFIAGQADGPIGSWATINGTQLAGYTSTGGVFAISTTTYGIAARGPTSVMPNDASADVHITSDGTSGSITLAGSPTNTVFSLQQDDGVAATVQLYDGVTRKALLANAFKISAGAAGLTVGENAGDGTVSATADNILFVNSEPSATLTVNAPIVNNGSRFVSIDKTGAGNVVFAGANAYSGVTAIANGTLTFADNGVTQTLAGAVSGNGALAKTGSGLLVLAGQNSYTGLTTIAAGTVLAQTNQAFGSAAGGTVIASGATLDVGANRTANTLQLGSEPITVSGSGVNGRGAIVNSSASSQYNALSYLTLAGNTVFGGENSAARWDLRNVLGSATLAMNNFTITKVGSNYVGLTAVTVSPGTGCIDVREGYFTLEVGTTLGGDSNNLMTVRSGAVFDVYQLSAPVAWTLYMEDNARFLTRSSTVSSNQNVWGGPVILAGRAVFDAVGAYTNTMRGTISGSGSVVKTYAGSTTYFLGTNTYSGMTIVSNGTLAVPFPRSLPGYTNGNVTLAAAGSLAIATGDGTSGWSSDQISALHDNSQLTTNTATLVIDTSLTGLSYAGNFTKPMSLYVLGTNVLTLAGTNTFGGTLTLNGSKLIMNGSGAHAIGALYLSGLSALVISNASAMCVSMSSNCCTYLGNGSADFGRITVAGNAAWTEYRYPYNVWQAPLYVGNSGRGILTVQDSASITQCLYVGNASSGAGAIYQNGGTVHNWGGSSSDPRIGVSGYGYYELNSGTFTNMGYTQLGENPAGIGILRQNGGAFKMGSVYGGQLGISRSGTGLVYVAGGTFATSVGINLCEASDNNLIRGCAEFTMGKTAGAAVIGGNINMADRTNSFAVLNLNGGVLTANQISKSSSRTGATAVVNLNGGTLCARTAGNLIASGANAPDVVNVYAGGALIDTTNLVCAIPVGLRAPAGSGVSAITLATCGGYMGPPFITITGGGGTGATAIAQFDSASGYVTGAIVTCPGYGYTNTPTVSLSGGGTNGQTTVTGVTLAVNVSGGLTKLGSGSLALSATNTYAGATTVSNGTLYVAVREALPSGTDLNVAGGMVDLGGFTLTNRAFNATGGSIVNGSLVCDSLTKSGNGTFTLATQIKTPNPVVVSGGTLRFAGAQPGLYEGMFTNNFNTTDANPKTAVRLTTRAANGGWGSSAASGGIWNDNSTYIYNGYLWNRATTNVTWTFAEQFDDSVLLKIDNSTVLSDGTWNAPTIKTVTLNPGAHAFELRLGQGGGGVGAPSPSWAWWTSTAFSFGADYLGRNDTNVANYVVMTDPGDGSLFSLNAVSSSTNLMDASSSVVLATNAVWDLGGTYQTVSGVSGAGLVSNGTLVVTGDLSPAGTNAVGNLSLACSVSLTTGRLVADVSSDGGCDLLAVSGSLALSPTSSLQIVKPELLNDHKTYVLATISGALTGTFGTTNLPGSHWHVIYGANNTIKLVFVSGTCILLK